MVGPESTEFRVGTILTPADSKQTHQLRYPEQDGGSPRFAVAGRKVEQTGLERLTRPAVPPYALDLRTQVWSLVHHPGSLNMNLDPRRHRKLDFILVVGAILLLWGPGATVSPGDAHRELTVPAAPAGTAGRTCCMPCTNHQLPDPPSTAAGGGAHPPIHATVTGYSSSVRETGSTLGLTAAGTPARHGVIALSQDLLREYTPGAPFTFHDRLVIPGIGSFSIEDTMHPRWTRRADIWFSSREEALRWGCRTRYLYRLPTNLAEALVLPGRREVAATFGQANFQ